MTHIALPARAKLNLDLRVTSKTADGFHEIVSTMQAIDLHDTLELSHAVQTSLTVSGLDVTASADNTVVRAHRALQSACARVLPTRFHLHKRIPPGSGMGGASSDAAAALRALKALHGLQDVDLAPIAQAVGADVPFFLRGGCARAESRGERLTALATEPAWFAIAWPRIELSTAAVYRAWDEVRGDGPNELLRAAAHVETKVADFAQKLGEGWRMTGSGSAFFKRCETEEQAGAAAAGLDCWTAVATSVGEW